MLICLVTCIKKKKTVGEIEEIPTQILMSVQETSRNKKLYNLYFWRTKVNGGTYNWARI